MKAKYVILLFVAGSCLVIVGALLKVMHWVGGDVSLLTGLFFEAAGVVLLVGKLLMHPRVRNFLNR